MLSANGLAAASDISSDATTFAVAADQLEDEEDVFEILAASILN